MKLEEVAKKYGMNISYYDSVSGLIYHLNSAKKNERGKLEVPVTRALTGSLLGFAEMEVVNG